MTARPSLVVGIGASAGGIPALEGFFRFLPADSGMAFVIITHLSPDRESLLHKVVANYTDLTVTVAEDGLPLRPDTVYVMPENAVLTLRDGHLDMQPGDPLARERKPVDVFLVAMAHDLKDRAVGIILSGGDSDGTLGVKAIREAGGVTLAQMPDGAHGPKNPQMPESAITTGMVDFVLTVEDMPARLIALAADRRIAELDRDQLPAGLTPALQADISALLRSQTGHDFSGYKSRTFLRRVVRRMQVTQAVSAEAYIDLLRTSPAEVTELFNDLLINVTNFFRDPEAFAALKAEILPRLFENRGADETIRIWVPGCATGEEAYSLAILMREEMATRNFPPRVQIFATDIDDHALSIARSARYPEQLLKGIDPARLDRFFVKEGASRVIAKEVREMCIFSAHSLISDPPFSRMDLVSCRNLLIYLGSGLQSQVIPTLHYALRPGGYLFLGSSEGVSGFGDLFNPVNKPHRIFQARATSSLRRRLPIQIVEHKLRQPRIEASPRQTDATVRHLGQITEAQVMDHHAPPHVVITPEGEVMHYSARITPFIDVPRGAPNRNIFDIARREIRLDLRAILRETRDSGAPVHRSLGLDEQVLDLTAEPLDGADRAGPLYLVIFNLRDPLPAEKIATPVDAHTAGERDLRELRDRLHSMIEEYEAALEELKASNEELLSVNEEVQSTNEELEASKEEMQSLNEELSTINGELNASVEDLARTNNDLKNLYAASRIATVFLDADLVIRNFTPAASDLFRIRASDIGRPLSDLVGIIDQGDLEKEIRQVFATGDLLEKRLTASNGQEFFVRLVPYRDAREEIGGVVLAFVDITSLVTAEGQQKVLIAELDHRVKNMLAVVISIVSNSADMQGTPREFAEILLGRLRAMARTHRLLAKTSWQAAELADIIALEAECHGEKRIVVHGPEVTLSSNLALPVAMIVHELATNATKYGALSVPQGQVSAEWTVNDRRLSLVWTERGGPKPTDVHTIGFGTTLIEGQVKHQLSGQCTMEYSAQGLVVRLEFPLDGPDA